MTLTDALAAALHKVLLPDDHPGHELDDLPEAAAILRDPAFREALTAALDGWWHPSTCTNEHDEGGNCLDADGCITGWRDDAAAIVAHLLPGCATQPDTASPDVRGDPENAEEAMRLALLYVFQAKQMTPMTAIAVIRALAQDGYIVTKPQPDTASRELREALERLVTKGEVDRDLYLNDPLFHAIAFTLHQATTEVGITMPPPPSPTPRLGMWYGAGDESFRLVPMSSDGGVMPTGDLDPFAAAIVAHLLPEADHATD